MAKQEEVRNHIRNEYAKIARKERKVAAGCCGGYDEESIGVISKRLGYSEKDFFDAPFDANMGLGCGNPVAIANLKEGETVIDLGSGGGFDCFIARKQVGEKGRVIGIDMTPDMITLARKNVQKSGYKNVEFRLGEIEYLPVADNAADVVISNCVINLSQSKQQVFSDVYRVLKKGGRISASDVVAIAEIPKRFKKDLMAISG